jgi:transposase
MRARAPESGIRERQRLLRERIQHTNPIRGLLFTQYRDYNPLRRDRRKRLEKLQTGDGRPLPAHLKAQILREIERLGLVMDQIQKLEAERDARAQAPGSQLRCSCASGASVPSSPLCSIARACLEISKSAPDNSLCRFGT